MNLGGAVAKGQLMTRSKQDSRTAIFIHQPPLKHHDPTI